MSIKASVGCFDKSELRSLRWAYARACQDLGFGPVPTQGGKRQERLAKIIFQIATTGEQNPEAIRRRAAMCFSGSVPKGQSAAARESATEIAAAAQPEQPHCSDAKPAPRAGEHAPHLG